jgi:hypothetical protein
VFRIIECTGFPGRLGFYICKNGTNWMTNRINVNPYPTREAVLAELERMRDYALRPHIAGYIDLTKVDDDYDYAVSPHSGMNNAEYNS